MDSYLGLSKLEQRVYSIINENQNQICFIFSSDI